MRSRIVGIGITRCLHRLLFGWESILETLWDVYTIQLPGISGMSIHYVKASDKKNWWKLKRVNLDLLIDTHGENDNDNDDVNNSNNNNINNK